MDDLSACTAWSATFGSNGRTEPCSHGHNWLDALVNTEFLSIRGLTRSFPPISKSISHGNATGVYVDEIKVCDQGLENLVMSLIEVRSTSE